MSPQVQQPQPYSTIDLTTLGQASPVRHDVDVASTSHQQQRDLSPYYNLSSSPGPSSPLSCNGSVSSPQPHGRKRMHNNQACRDSRKKKKVKREELKEKEIELIADNEVQRKKIAQLEVEVAKTRDIILKLMVRGAARSWSSYVAITILFSLFLHYCWISLNSSLIVLKLLLSMKMFHRTSHRFPLFCIFFLWHNSIFTLLESRYMTVQCVITSSSNMQFTADICCIWQMRGWFVQLITRHLHSLCSWIACIQMFKSIK